MPLTTELIGPPLEATLRKLTKIEDQVTIGNLINSFKNEYDSDGYKATILYDGVIEMLEAFAKVGIKLYLATNKRIDPTRKILNHFSLHSYFLSIYTPDVGAIRFKSKSEMLTAMLKRESLNIAESFYVGDIQADYEAAKYSGINFIHAQWGYEKSGHHQYPLVATDIRDLIQKILG